MRASECSGFCSGTAAGGRSRDGGFSALVGREGFRALFAGMLSQVFSAAVIGVDAYEVEIEVNTASSVKTLVVVVGLPDIAVKESRDRVTTAVANSGYFWPQGRTTVNLAPADVK